MDQENPYAMMLNTFRKDASDRASAPWALGVVTSIAPLTVLCGDIVLTGADLLVNHQLRENQEQVRLEDIKGTLQGATDCASGSITKLNTTGGTLEAVGTFGGVLAVGDQVAMLVSGDGQQYVVLCKVVAA